MVGQMGFGTAEHLVDKMVLSLAVMTVVRKGYWWAVQMAPCWAVPWAALRVVPKADR